VNGPNEVTFGFRNPFKKKSTVMEIEDNPFEQASKQLDFSNIKVQKRLREE